MNDYWKALTIYSYYDGPQVFSALRKRDGHVEVYLFRWLDNYPSGDPDDNRTYKADGHDITITEDEVDWSEATA